MKPEHENNSRVEIVARRPELVLRIDGREHAVMKFEAADNNFHLVIDQTVYRGSVFETPEATWVRFHGWRTFVVPRKIANARAGSSKNNLEVKADMPGTVVAVHVNEGDRVSDGDPIVTVESMKLQLTVNADRSGTIARVFLAAGATFDRGALLAAYRPANRPEEKS